MLSMAKSFIYILYLYLICIFTRKERLLKYLIIYLNTDPKIILDHQNNYVEKLIARM